MSEAISARSSKDNNTAPARHTTQKPVRSPVSTGPYGDIMQLQSAAGNRAVSQLVQGSDQPLDPDTRAFSEKGRLNFLSTHFGQSREVSSIPHFPYTAGNPATGSARFAQERTAAQNEYAFRGTTPRRQSSPRPWQSTPPTGRPLDAINRRVFESRLGHSFADVRIFADGESARAARALNARAFTHGADIFFGEREYSPATCHGQALLAHELTHVVQQRLDGQPGVMCRGGTVSGFFGNLFRFWAYSREALEAYLDELRRTDDIVDDYDSDDMARQIAAEWDADHGAYQLSPRMRVLLIREMLSGAVTGADQEGVMRLLEGSRNTELQDMIGSGARQIDYAEIHGEFGGWRPRLELFNERVLQRLDTFREAPAGGKTLLDKLEETEQYYGLHVEQVSLSFHLDAGALYKSFLVDIVVPRGGTTVKLTVTREQFRISIFPGILIDIIGPVNDTLHSVRFGFQGLQPDVGLANFSKIGTEKAAAYLRELLKGTRFAEPGYDFTQDPNLLNEIQDGSIIGDIERVRYNFEKNQEPEDKAQDEEVDERLGMISRLGGTLSLTHPKERRVPESEEGYGLLIPAGTQFFVSMDVTGRGSELYQRDAVLERLRFQSSGLYVVHDGDRLVLIEGFDLLPGFNVELRGFRELTDLLPYVREALPESIAGPVVNTLEVLDKWKAFFDSFPSLLDSLSGQRGRREPPSSVTGSLVQVLAEFVFGMEAASLVRSFKEPIRTYTGMSEKQIDRFFRR